MMSDLAQQHRQNNQIRDTCASQRKALARQREAVRRQRELLPTNQDPQLNATGSNRQAHSKPEIERKLKRSFRAAP